MSSPFPPRPSSSSLCSMPDNVDPLSSPLPSPIPLYFFPNRIVMTHTIHTRHTTNNVRLINQYAIGHRVGKGQHGEVFKGYVVNDDNRAVAIKACKRKNPREARLSQLRQNNPMPRTRPGQANLVDRVESAEKVIKREIAIMKKCNHGQIVQLYEVIDDRLASKILMIMEYMGGGEVKWRDSHENPVLTADQARRISRDVILGLEYLHYQGIIHRDIKPANLLWTSDRMNVKITDFGVAHFSYAQRLNAAGAGAENEHTAEETLILDDSSLSRTAGTPAFLAPEVVWGMGAAVGTDAASQVSVSAFSSPPQSAPASASPSNDSLSDREHDRPPVTKAIDVWALGVTLYCLLFGTTPWTGPNEWHLYGQLGRLDFTIPDTMGFDRIKTGGRHHTPDDQSEGAVVVRLLARMLEKDYSKRIALDEMKRLPWILRDIPNAEEWLRETSPSQHAAVKVSAAETNVAMSSVKFRYPGLPARLMRFFRGVRSTRSVGTSTRDDSQGPDTARPPAVSSKPPRKSELSKRASIRSLLHDKGKSKGKASQRRSREHSPDRSLDSGPPTPRLSRGSEAMLASGPSTSSIRPTPCTTDHPEGRIREKPRSALSLSFIRGWRPLRWTSGVRSPSSEDSAPKELVERALARRSADEIGRQKSDDAIGELTAVMRASSWGDVADEHERATETDVLGSDYGSVDYQEYMVGAGGVLSRAVSRNSVSSTAGSMPDDSVIVVSNGLGLTAASGLPLPLIRPQSERLLGATDTSVSPDPAREEPRSARPHAMSPLAQSICSFDNGSLSVFDDDDDDGGDDDDNSDEDEEDENNWSGDRVYGRGSTQVYDESSSDEEAQQLEIRRRRPSASLVRSSFQRPSPDENVLST